MSERLTNKSIRLSEDEVQELSLICETESLSESALMRRWVREGIYAYKLTKAVQLYQEAGYSLGQAVDATGVTQHDLMAELERRGLPMMRSWDQLDHAVATLAELFDQPELLSAFEEGTRQADAERMHRAS